MSTIKQLHAAWATRVLPKNPSQVQKQEMERAFYSGFFAGFSLIVEISDGLTENEAERRLQSLQDEAMAYFKTLGQAPRDISRS